MTRTCKIAVSAFVLVLYAAQCIGQDTVRRPKMLPEAVVSEEGWRPHPEAAQTPTQTVGQKELEERGQTRLSDAARHLTGVTLKDYGGVGGVKTVSARGLGSQFSLLEVDGVAVSDCQNGQVDLGRYLTAGSSGVAFANGQYDTPLQTARALSAGSLVSIESRPPRFEQENTHLRIGMEGGSFGYLSPTLGWEQRLSRRLSISLLANYMQSEGDYPFTLYYTASQGDSSSRERRSNSQMRMGTADLGGFLRIDSRRTLHFKAHYMRGFHALPGPVVFYSVKGTEHTEEELFFAQGRYRKSGDKSSLQFIAKYRLSNDLYADTAAHTPSGLLTNRYRQQEAYLSQALHHRLAQGGMGSLSLSLSADEALNTLASNLASHNDVQRLSLLAAAAAHYHSRPGSNEGLRIDANLLGTWVQDREQADATSYARLSPYAGASFSNGGLTLRYFFKECYRVPNFNELYYFTVGRSLRPERARQHNAGIAYSLSRPLAGGSSVLKLSASADAYLNFVDNKIVAVPTQNMFLWSMSNVGRVHIAGADLLAGCTAAWGGRRRWTLSADAGCSLQHAVDRTDPDSKTYGHQIPYTPAVSGNISLTAATPWATLTYTATLVGSRYSQYQNTPQSRLPGYADQGLTLSRDFRLGHTTLHVRLQALNLFDVQYEVVKNYPMMGRNYRAALTWAL